jgi:uncharacterized membrane protein
MSNRTYNGSQRKRIGKAMAEAISGEIVSLKMITTQTYNAQILAAQRYLDEYKDIINNMSLTEMCALRLATDRQDKDAIYNLIVGKFIYNRAHRGGT